jgi:hypothetical protein
MAGYIGSKASVVSSGAEHKKTFTITGATTSLTGLNYTVGKVHVFQNGVRLVDGTDYTATNSTTITLTVAAQSGDNVVVISQASYQVALSGIDDQSNATALTIDSSENVLIGKTATGISAAGHSYKADGTWEVRRDISSANSSSVGYLSRGTTDGNILTVYKDTTAVGSIGSSNAGERLYMVNDSTGLSFIGDFSNIFPCDSSGTPRDNAINLGGVGGRFKDAYLSGGVYLGGTGSANKLDDYEEGTWTPTHTGGSGTGSFSDARYTKIGNTVHIYFAFSFSSGGGSMAISGFPFNCNGNTVGIGREDQTNGYGVYGRINAGDSTVYIYATQASSNASAYQVSSGAIKFAMTYETNS